MYDYIVPIFQNVETLLNLHLEKLLPFSSLLPQINFCPSPEKLLHFTHLPTQYELDCIYTKRKRQRHCRCLEWVWQTLSSAIASVTVSDFFK